MVPALTPECFDQTSAADAYYNCFAWAAEDDQNWWQPEAGGGYYWPPGVARASTLESYVSAYETLGYRVCQSTELEHDYQKIALYVSQAGIPTHAARQLATGQWTSKIGQADDIWHASLDGLEGDLYGHVAVIMQRPVTR